MTPGRNINCKEILNLNVMKRYFTQRIIVSVMRLVQFIEISEF